MKQRLSAQAARDAPLSLARAVDDAIRETVAEALRRTDGNGAEAGELLGVKRHTVYRWARRFGLKLATGRRK